MKIKKFNISEKIVESVVAETFGEIDWIKMKIMSHITEAYNRGKNEK